MFQTRWNGGVSALALLALVGVFLAPPQATAFFPSTALSSRLRNNTTGGGAEGRSNDVAVASERSRRSALFGIKRKVDNLEENLSGSVVDPGTGGVMGALGNDVDALMATIEKNKQRSAEVAAAAAEQAKRDLEGTGSGDAGAAEDNGAADGDTGDDTET